MHMPSVQCSVLAQAWSQAPQCLSLLWRFSQPDGQHVVPSPHSSPVQLPSSSSQLALQQRRHRPAQQTEPSGQVSTHLPSSHFWQLELQPLQ